MKHVDVNRWNRTLINDISLDKKKRNESKINVRDYFFSSMKQTRVHLIHTLSYYLFWCNHSFWQAYIIEEQLFVLLLFSPSSSSDRCTEKKKLGWQCFITSQFGERIIFSRICLSILIEIIFHLAIFITLVITIATEKTYTE